MAKATLAQAAFIEKLQKELGKASTGCPANKQHASELIELLLAQRQASWAQERAARTAAEQDAMELVQPLQPGRKTFIGTVVSIKVQHGVYGMSFKMLLKDELGRKVWMTVPKTILGETSTLEELKGLKVAGVVTLQPKEDEPHFAFGRRPAGWYVAA